MCSGVEDTVDCKWTRFETHWWVASVVEVTSYRCSGDYTWLTSSRRLLWGNVHSHLSNNLPSTLRIHKHIATQLYNQLLCKCIERSKKPTLVSFVMNVVQKIPKWCQTCYNNPNQVKLRCSMCPAHRRHQTLFGNCFIRRLVDNFFYVYKATSCTQSICFLNHPLHLHLLRRYRRDMTKKSAAPVSEKAGFTAPCDTIWIQESLNNLERSNW